MQNVQKHISLLKSHKLRDLNMMVTGVKDQPFLTNYRAFLAFPYLLFHYHSSSMVPPSIAKVMKHKIFQQHNKQ